MNSPRENSVPGGAIFTGLFNEAFVANPFPLLTQLRSQGAVVACLCLDEEAHPFG